MSYLTVDLAEFPRCIAECHNLRRTHECEVQRVEEENQVLSAVVVKTDLLELPVDGCLTFEKRSSLL